MKSFLVFSCFLAFVLVAPGSALAADDARRLVALVDYIGGDYKNAVREGKIVDEGEYQEMREFAQRIVELQGRLQPEARDGVPELAADVNRLSAYIKGKKDGKLVAELAARIKEELLAAYEIVPFPREAPSLRSGRIVYSENCGQCHGEKGRGDGLSRKTMKPQEPPPANFTDFDLMDNLSPFKACNTLTFGIKGTAMPSFSALPEKERWEVAFLRLLPALFRACRCSGRAVASAIWLAGRANKHFHAGHDIRRSARRKTRERASGKAGSRRRFSLSATRRY